MLFRSSKLSWTLLWLESKELDMSNLQEKQATFLPCSPL